MLEGSSHSRLSDKYGPSGPAFVCTVRSSRIDGESSSSSLPAIAASRRGLLTGDAAIDLGVLLVVSMATLLTAPLWVARTAADRSGIRVNHRRPRSLVPWADIAEIQTIRKRNTERVALKLRAGGVRRLHAPYSGWGLANDPDFDDKVDTLRTMWRRHGAPA
jgi:hypothetical protein